MRRYLGGRMKLKTVSATYGRKHNLGDYNSAHVEISLWADLEDGDDEAAAADALRQMARNQVMAELGRLDQRIAAKVQDLFMGLPLEVRNQLEDK
jgi:hypothetical protein